MSTTTSGDPVSLLGHIGITVGCLAAMAPLLWLAWYDARHYLKPGKRGYYQTLNQVVFLVITSAFLFVIAGVSLLTI